MHNEEYLGKTMQGVELSDIQKEIVKRGSQIYKLETLIELYGFDKGRKIFGETNRNLLLMLGKGSGKDFTSRITCSYIIYKLLCLKDPSRYFGAPSDDDIVIVNMALNAEQAYRVFFNPLKKMLLKSPWFSSHMVGPPHVKDIEFEKSLFIYSLHSDPEAAEGLNVMVAVLDEIDGFNVEVAQEMYHYLSQAVVSRFPEYGKVICLSFPRSKTNWMMLKYDEIVNERDAETFEHVFKLNYDLDDGQEGNEFTVRWQEDTVLSYKQDNWFAIKAPTFRVNPRRKVEDYRDMFFADLEANTAETLLRVCANPPDHLESTFFKNQDYVRLAFDQENGYNHKTDTIEARPKEDKEYFIHVDLSKVSDRTVVAMGHVDHWQQVNIGGAIQDDVKPFIEIDLFRIWEPSANNHIDNVEVTDFILKLAKQFNLRMVTFDRWGSIDMIDYLNERGIDAERQSLDRASYMEFKLAVDDKRIKGPNDKKFLKELKHLILNPKNGKVDHPEGKEHYNDISEAVCGTVNNCVAHAMEELEVRIVTRDTVRKEMLREAEMHDSVNVTKKDPDGDFKSFLDQINFV